MVIRYRRVSYLSPETDIVIYKSVNSFTANCPRKLPAFDKDDRRKSTIIRGALTMLQQKQKLMTENTSESRIPERVGKRVKSRQLPVYPVVCGGG